MRTPRAVLSLLVPALAFGLLIGPAAPAEATSAPAVTITAHTAAVTQWGSVSATGTTPATSGDYPASMSVYLQGKLVSEVLDPVTISYVPGPVLCDGPAKSTSCTLTISYPVGTFVGSGTLVVTMTTAQGHVFSSAPVSVVASVDPATVGIFIQQGPQPWTPLPDQLTVTQDRYLDLVAEGGSDWEHEVYTASTELLVDGAAVSAATCPQPTSSCGTEYFWSIAQTPVGRHTFQARLTLVNGDVVLGTVSHVQVDPAPASVAVSSPTEGATVSGLVHLTATGTVLPDKGDAVASMSLSVDGTPTGAPIACPTDAHPTTCAVILTWDSTSVPDGPHVLSAVLLTRNNYTTPADVDVQVVNAPPATPPSIPTQPQPTVPNLPGPAPVTLAATPTSAHVALAAAPVLPRGSVARVHLTVTSALDLAVLANVPVTVTFTALDGRGMAVPVTTDSAGHATATAPTRLTVATLVVAAVGTGYVATPASEVLRVRVVVTCRAAATSPRTHTETITCNGPGLAGGARAALHYSSAAGHGILHSAAKAGVVTYRLHLTRAGWVSVWVVTSPTAALVSSRSRDYAVHVR